MSTATRLLPDLSFGLGESSVWDDRSQTLYWVDIRAPTLHRLDTQTGAHTGWEWPDIMSCYGLTVEGNLVVAGRSELWSFDPDSAARTLTYPIPALAGDMRTNDVKVRPDGAFWVSTMRDRAGRGPIGVVIRIDPQGEVRTMLEGITTANGIEWSPDGRTFYLSDTRTLKIDHWDYDPDTVTLSNRQPFVTYHDGEGKPDGRATDSAYWSAGIYAGLVHRFSPQGTRIQSLPIPASMVTVPCFGGADMKTLFITNLAPEGDDTVEGGHYSMRLDTASPPPRRFAHTSV